MNQKIDANMDRSWNYEALEELYDRLKDNLNNLSHNSEKFQRFAVQWKDLSSRPIPVRKSSPGSQSSKSSAAPKWSAEVQEFESFDITAFIGLVLIVINFFIRPIPSSVFILLTILLTVQYFTEHAEQNLLHKRAISNFKRMKKVYFYMTIYKLLAKSVGNCAINTMESMYVVINDLKCLNHGKICPEAFAEAVNTINEILALWSNRYQPVDHSSLSKSFPQVEYLLQRFFTGLWLTVDDEEEFTHFMKTTPVPTRYQLNGWEMENEEMEQCLLRISRGHKQNVILSKKLYKIFNRARGLSNRHDFLTIYNGVAYFISEIHLSGLKELIQNVIGFRD